MKPLQRALEIEQQVARIIGEQSTNGVQFDARRAKFYEHALEERTRALYRSIRPHLQLEVESPYGVPVNKPWLKSGAHCAASKAWFSEPEQLDNIGGVYTRVRFVEPDLGKRAKIVAQLLRLGWNPREYTPATEKGGGNNPKITVDGEPCPSLLEIDSEIGKLIASWYTYKHRQSQLKGLLGLVRDDGRISAEAHTIGTPTYRFRHRGVVNIPKGIYTFDKDQTTWFWPKGKPIEKNLFGKQMRSLFTVKDDDIHKRINERGRLDTLINIAEKVKLGRLTPEQAYKLVGHDASGLELRVLAHYINDEKFTKEVSEGDPHTANQLAAGLPTRDDAKTFIYAFIYGAGNKKIGSIIGGGLAEGRAIKDRFLAANPKLGRLIEGVQSAASKGWVKGIDGRRIRIRRDPLTNRPQVHKGLNTLIQAGGALVMKYSMVWLDIAWRKEGLDVTKVIDMHDEGQAEVSSEDSQRYAWLAEQSIRVAGKYLGLRCPLDAEAKVNTRWSKTH